MNDRSILLRTGSANRLLFVAYLEASELVYASILATHMSPEISVYGVPLGGEADRVRLRTVEGMAERMTRMIRAVQPIGPYQIAGWCFGATLAYEVAVQLIGQDQVVRFLGLLGTSLRVRSNGCSGRFVTDKYGTLLSQTEPGGPNGVSPLVHDGSQSKTTPVAVGALGTDRQEKEQQNESRDDRTPTKNLDCDDRELRFHLAETWYRAQPISIPIHLFTVRGRSTSESLRVNGGWANDLIRVIPLDGEPDPTFGLPDAKVLGEALSTTIGNASFETRTVPERDYAPLVTLDIGRRDKIPLFCVPGAGASVVSFAELITYLDKSCPIYGFEARGLDGQLVPHSTVVAAAGCYERAIYERYPKGPIHLLGHSFGGWVAFEMARRLQEAGWAIASLTILDSEPPSDEGVSNREYNPTEAIMEWVEIFEMFLGCALEIRPDDLDSRDELSQLNLLHERLVRFGLMSGRTSPDVLRGPLHAFTTCLRTQYIPNDIYSGFARLVLVNDPRMDQVANRREHQVTIERWKRWMPNLIALHGPGNHVTTLRPPYVKTLGKLLGPAWG